MNPSMELCSSSPPSKSFVDRWGFAGYLIGAGGRALAPWRNSYPMRWLRLWLFSLLPGGSILRRRRILGGRPVLTVSWSSAPCWPFFGYMVGSQDSSLVWWAGRLTFALVSFDQVSEWQKNVAR